MGKVETMSVSPHKLALTLLSYRYITQLFTCCFEAAQSPITQPVFDGWDSQLQSRLFSAAATYTKDKTMVYIDRKM